MFALGVTSQGDVTLMGVTWISVEEPLPLIGTLPKGISFVVKEICKGLLQRIFNHVAGI